MTFWLTIFGTFLTRSGLITSVHSFAQSGIGIYFVWFMGVIAAFSIALIIYRLPLLRSEGRIESVLSSCFDQASRVSCSKTSERLSSPWRSASE